MIEMYNVVAFHKAYPGTLVFQFNSIDNAGNAQQLIVSAIQHNTATTVEDDYGVRAMLCGGDFSAVTMTHLNRHLDGQRAASLLQQIAQAKLEQDVKNDPVMKFHSKAQGFGGNPQMG